MKSELSILTKNKLGVFLGLQKSSLQHDSLGHGESYNRSSRSSDWQKSGYSIASHHNKGINLYMKEANLKEVEQMVDKCHKRGIRVVMTTMPEWESYRDNVDRHALGIFMSSIDSLSRSCGIPWFNYWADPRFGENDFYDADHLNSDIGATKFTGILMHDINVFYGDTIFAHQPVDR